MIKKIFITIITFTLAMTFLTGCTKSLSYYDKIDTAIELSEHIKELYNDKKVKIGEKINNKNVNDYCTEESSMYKILNSDNESRDFEVAIIDENNILVSTNVIFNYVEGYIVTSNPESLDFDSPMAVPESLGYDGNQITNISVIDQYAGKVYTYRAGL